MCAFDKHYISNDSIIMQEESKLLHNINYYSKLKKKKTAQMKVKATKHIMTTMMRRRVCWASQSPATVESNHNMLAGIIAQLDSETSGSNQTAHWVIPVPNLENLYQNPLLGGRRGHVDLTRDLY